MNAKEKTLESAKLLCPVTQDEIDFDAETTEERREPVSSGLPSSEPEKLPTSCPQLSAELSPEPPGSRNGKGEPEQIVLLNLPEDWEAHWKGMPEFAQKNLAPWKTVYVHFENRSDMESFARLTGQTITLNTRSIWWPEAEIGRMIDKRYIDALESQTDEIEILDEQ